MPLPRFVVRNEYGLGHPELYRNVDRDDPKAVLDGVAVSGLVGILRQLGDLADFAAGMFHDIQEEVMMTASRSHKLMIRLQNIEAAVPSLEKTVLAQTSHLHFAYTAGREWHPSIRNGQNHFIYSDLPRYVMDSYEECRGPPRLHLLDKFDIDGPGSCLKRYSDPTYFRRVSGNLIGANSKIQKDKNRKAKRKKSSQRKRDISRLASMTDQSDRRRFSPLAGQTSSSRTASTAEMGFKSDLQDHSCSLDSRSGPAHIECFSNVASSVKTEEKLPRVSSSSSLTQRAPTTASILSDYQSEGSVDNVMCSHSQEQAGHLSSCISWDEKAEIFDSNGLKCVRDEAPEMMKTSFDMDAPEARDVDQIGGVDHRSNDIEAAESVSTPEQQNVLKAERSIKNGLEIERKTALGRELKMDSEHDETESDGDNYVDALNTIDSELESDLGLRVTLEAQKNSTEIKDEELESSLYEHDTAQPWHSGQETKQNSNNVEDGRLVDGFTDHGLGADETTSAAFDVGKIERTTCSFLGPASSVNASDKQIPQVPGLDSDVKNSAPRDSLHGSSSPLHVNGGKKEESEVVSRDDHQSIRIWTNGNLLGLEPSKPPVFADPHAGNKQSDNAKQTCANELALANSSVATPGIDRSIKSDIAATLAGDQPAESCEISPGVLSLSRRLLMDGFRKKDSLAYDRKTVPATIPENTELNEKSESCIQAVEEEKIFKDPFLDEIPFDWLASSPPLEHMKISFKSADSPQTSHLKLNFPDRIHCHEGNKFTFSSFQLVPEPATSLGDTDSDDDTFCGSSHGVSDNYYPSDSCSISNSEQWEESRESPERNDQELYDSLQRNMHTENASAPSSLSAPLPDVPSFEILKRGPFVSGSFSYRQNPTEPSAPPLPPSQWRVSKIPTDGFEEKQQSIQDALKRAFEQKVSLSASTQQSSVASEQTNIVSRVPRPENFNVHQRNNGREDKLNMNMEETETETETGDFLRQIQMKQSNLRRTAATRPPAAAETGPTTNFKINAILEKANSIRQAVGSDDGDETDEWSDT